MYPGWAGSVLCVYSVVPLLLIVMSAPPFTLTPDMTQNLILALVETSLTLAQSLPRA